MASNSRFSKSKSRSRSSGRKMDPGHISTLAIIAPPGQLVRFRISVEASECSQRLLKVFVHEGAKLFTRIQDCNLGELLEDARKSLRTCLGVAQVGAQAQSLIGVDTDNKGVMSLTITPKGSKYPPLKKDAMRFLRIFTKAEPTIAFGPFVSELNAAAKLDFDTAAEIAKRHGLKNSTLQTMNKTFNERRSRSRTRANIGEAFAPE